MHSRQRRQRGRRQQEHVASYRQHEEKAEPPHAEEAQRLHPLVHPTPALSIAEPVDDRKDPHHDERRRQRHPERRRRRQSRGDVRVAGQEDRAHHEHERMKETSHQLMLPEPACSSCRSRRIRSNLIEFAACGCPPPSICAWTFVPTTCCATCPCTTSRSWIFRA